VSDKQRGVSKVSVVVPVWNRVTTIERAIRSALEQTHPPHEVIVCDDGSTDGTAEVLLRLASEDSRVRVLWGERSGGPAAPRNRGVAHAEGEWLAFLDSDDEWLPGKLEAQSIAAERSGCLAVCSNAIRWIPGTGARGPLIDWSRDSLTFEDLVESNRVLCSSAVLHRSLLTRVGGFPEMHRLRSREDYALWLRVSLLTDFAYVPQELVLYRDDPSTSIRGDVGRSEWLKTLAVVNLLSWCLARRPSRLYRVVSALVRQLGRELRQKAAASGVQEG